MKPTTPEPPASPVTVPPHIELRRALGAFATGVTVVSTLRASGSPIGLTVNSFNALSLDPPLVLWSLRGGSSCLAAFMAATHFTVNVLSAEQIGISRQFTETPEDRFKGITWRPWRYDHGSAPLLKGCTATFECRTISHQIAGDHVLFIGQVEQHRFHPERQPLVFYGGCFHRLGDAV